MRIVELESSLHIVMPASVTHRLVRVSATALAVLAAAHALLGMTVPEDPLGIGLLALLLVAGLLASDARGSITLSRADGSCRLRRPRTGLGSTRSLPLAAVRRAALERRACRDYGIERYRVLIETSTDSLPLTPFVTATAREELRGVCDAINGFLRHERGVLRA